MPGYIKSTYIDQTTIRSPVIEGGEFYGEEFNIIAGSDFGSFNLYGPFGSSRYHMLAIEYFEGDAPLINIYSPCGGYITIGQPTKRDRLLRGNRGFQRRRRPRSGFRNRSMTQP